MYNKIYRAFTLSETLITLTIIGIIAAISIPAIHRNYQRRNVATRITKFYSSWQQAFDLSQIENGPLTSWSIDNYNNSSDVDKDLYEKYITPYLSLENGGNRDSVYRTHNLGDYYTIKQPNGNSANNSSINWGFYRLKGGICIHPNIQNKNGKVIYKRNPSTGITYYAEAYVDINCEKGPNVAGKDSFLFQIFYDENTGLPYIAPNEYVRNISTSKINSLKTNCKNGGNGHLCTFWILKDGFNKIPKDYPWL